MKIWFFPNGIRVHWSKPTDYRQHWGLVEWPKTTILHLGWLSLELSRYHLPEAEVAT